MQALPYGSLTAPYLREQPYAAEEMAMVELPADLLAAIPPASMSIARSCWASLSEDDRRQVACLWDDRREVHFFTPQPDEAGRLDEWEQVPAVKGGRFIPSDDAWGLAEWGPGYFEHLLQHPEVVLLWEPAQRTLYIGCTRHAAARSCLESGAVPADFACPVSTPSCPLLPLRGTRLSARADGRGSGTSLVARQGKPCPTGLQ